MRSYEPTFCYTHYAIFFFTITSVLDSRYLFLIDLASNKKVFNEMFFSAPELETFFEYFVLFLVIASLFFICPWLASSISFC